MLVLGISYPYGGSFFIYNYNTTEFVKCYTINPYTSS